MQRVECEVGAQRPRGVPADDVTGAGVDDEGYVGEARLGAHVGKVGDPEPVGLFLRLSRGFYGQR